MVESRPGRTRSFRKAPNLDRAKRPFMSRRILAIVLPAGLLTLVCLRSWVFLRYPHSHFDSDQAVFGLMSRDLIAGRAIPALMYGRRYLLAVSVWLCAPLIAVFGSSVLVLKLPLFLMNLAAVLMLWRELRREGLDHFGTTVAILPFSLCGVVLSSRLVEHAGGNFEPFVFVIGAYVLRGRPIWLGILLGVAYLNREFTLLALIALLLTDIASGKFRVRFKQRLLTVVCMVPLVYGVRWLATYSPSYFGPDAASQTAHPSWENVKGFFAQQLPSLLAATPQTLRDYNITSSLTVGYALLYAVLACWTALVFIWLILIRRLSRYEISGFSAYLLLVGSGQAAAFICLSPYPFNVMHVRYVILLLLAVMGLIGLAWRRPALRPFTAGLVLVMTGYNLVDHVRLLREYAQGPPRNDLEQLAGELLARGVQYGRADYWTAYDVAWQTQERIILAPERGQTVRMLRYERLVSQYASRAFNISDGPCRGGEYVLRWYICPPAGR